MAWNKGSQMLSIELRDGGSWKQVALINCSEEYLAAQVERDNRFERMYNFVGSIARFFVGRGGKHGDAVTGECRITYRVVGETTTPDPTHIWNPE